MVVRETPEEVWQHLAADFKGPIIGNGKSYYFHVVIDLLSRWPEVAVVSSTAFDKLQPSMERIWALHGVGEVLTSWMRLLFPAEAANPQPSVLMSTPELLKLVLSSHGNLYKGLVNGS